MDITVHITYYPMEAKYGASLWQGNSMIDIDYQLYDTKQIARKMGALLKTKYINKGKGE